MCVCKHACVRESERLRLGRVCEKDWSVLGARLCVYEREIVRVCVARDGVY